MHAEDAHRPALVAVAYECAHDVACGMSGEPSIAHHEAEGCEHREIIRETRPADRIENEIDLSASCGSPHAFGNILHATIDDKTRAQGLDEFDLCHPAADGDDLETGGDGE